MSPTQVTDEGRMEACKTYIEQTKLLVTLASAFVVAPAALIPFFTATAGVLAAHVRSLGCWMIWAEVSFIISVLAGYTVLATVAGSQHNGTFNVYRTSTRVCSLAEIGSYLVGLALFVRFLFLVLSHVAGH
jgi:hypothetical protein